MRWLITGAAGMLGRELVRRLAENEEDVAALGHDHLDVTRPSAVRAALAEHRPGIVVNCAAYTAVDDAETDEAAAALLNAEAPRLLAEACAPHGARLVHLSTDYVFPGDARTPYAEDHPTAPRSAYGRTKRDGEQAVLTALPTATVLRTAWLYGRTGRSFVRTMIEREARGGAIDVVADQRGQPTWTGDLADRIVAVGRLPGVHGILHATNAGSATWYDLAQEVFRLLGADPGRVRPTTGAAFRRPAPRPAYSVLGHDRWRGTGLVPLRDWRSALREAFPDILAAEHPPTRRGAA
ncbi:dTDP-4-dehydrorhamnose reductase [Streptomyces lavenduligriseus]|uniref:dTDP-4-dehydrorhamnose reductase n=1 Tax=Streptomyces lavenduligriseus TaxID=67315 RepID=A0ABT0NLX3_9ACTN|nr:dTDP-4-dehydrorhamnose reductase [Streptomyces lavenduligriseus]MCL3992448.1 dTDP-4-dehydrorhamnose reductase [Streptomyces lavenduligriseus]